MNYLESLDYIQNISRSGSDYGIERMRELLVLLDNPDCKLKFIHVAGTNGKGSTTANISSILRESGYKVGTYNSPSVFKYNERWLINSMPISNEKVAYYLTKVKDVISKENEKRIFNPTAFEIETAVAFLLFLDEKCDLCVLEVGLGGKWDATNVILDKELSVITRIGLDHCYLLGDTLGKIASEKAAIIKDYSVTCFQSDEVINEIKNSSKECYVVRPGKPIEWSLIGQKFLFENNVFETSLLGDHQIENACLSIKACEILSQKYPKITIDTIKLGLKNSIWHARFEIVKDANLFGLKLNDNILVFDGSHNPQGAETLSSCIKKYFNKKVHLVLGILKDKDYNGICDILLPNATSVTCVTPSSPRALDANELNLIVLNHNVDSHVSNNIKEAVQSALNNNDIVVLCGSLTLFENLIEE